MQTADPSQHTGLWSVGIDFPAKSPFHHLQKLDLHVVPFQVFINRLKVIRFSDDLMSSGRLIHNLVPLYLNNKKRSHTQLDSRKQVTAFQDRVITINIKEAQHPLKREKQVIDKSSIMLKISTKSMHRVLV